MHLDVIHHVLPLSQRRARDREREATARLQLAAGASCHNMVATDSQSTSRGGLLHALLHHAREGPHVYASHTEEHSQRRAPSGLARRAAGPGRWSPAAVTRRCQLQAWAHHHHCHLHHLCCPCRVASSPRPGVGPWQASPLAICDCGETAKANIQPDPGIYLCMLGSRVLAMLYVD